MSEEFVPYGRPQSSTGNQLRAWRTHFGLKQGELEDKVGLSHNSVSRIETGTVSPRLDTLERLAEAMGISVEQLQFKKPPEIVCEAPTTYMDSLIARMMSLPDSKRSRLLDVMKNLLDLTESES